MWRNQKQLNDEDLHMYFWELKANLGESSILVLQGFPSRYVNVWSHMNSSGLML